MTLEAAATVVTETGRHVRDAYQGSIGRAIDDLVTPALILDAPAARRNIELMGRRMESMPAALRPHIKVHKSPELSRLQVDAGAQGLSMATVWEAVALAASGLDDLFVVNTVTGRDKLAALAALARERRILVAIDNADNARTLGEAATAAGSTLSVLIEVDTGMDRAGVDNVDAGLELARTASTIPGIRLEGLTGYEGHCSLTPERELRHERQIEAMQLLNAVADAIREDGIPLPILSAGGTATWEWAAATPGITEIQAGSYVVMDNFHGAMIPEFERAVTVATRVISTPVGRVIVDAGVKSLGDPNGSTMRGFGLPPVRFDEEHGVFESASDGPALGEVVQLDPGYAPSTVNWYEAFHVVEDGRVVDIWPVVPRGPGHGGLLKALLDD
jgi:D-serine deaminase-like pyridoxal phosphate-dependent protein